jgi:TolA-binding protein
MSPLLLLTLAAPAHALTCDEVMNMVNVNVPESIVVQTIESSGESFSAEFVRCLTNEGAPDSVVGAVKKLIAANSAPKDSAPAEDDDEEAPPPKSKKEAARESFDKEESVGGSKRKELTDKGGEEEDTARDPEKLDDAIRQYKAKKPLSASFALHDLLKDNTYPEKESKILYYMGMSLYDLKMYHTAQYYFIEVLKKGTGNPYFKYALPKLVSIAKYTGDVSDLQKVVEKISPEDYPRSARSQLYYLRGLQYYEEDRLSDAKKMLQQVSEKSDLYTRATYLVGVIDNKQGKLKSAVRSFREIAQSKPDAPTLQELESLDKLRELSALNIARIYYGIAQFDQAKEFYSQVPRDSVYWAEAQFEMAWTSFMLSDLNYTLGEILTVESPYYADHEFVPEATVLRALTYFNLCQFDDVERTLKEFESTYTPVHTELKDTLKAYSTEEGRKLSDQAYERYFESKGDTVLPKSLFLHLLRDQELAGLVQHLALLDTEEQIILSQKSQWKTAVGEELMKVIAESRERLKKRAGRALLRNMVSVTKQLGDLIGQAQIIQFEVVDARRADYTYRMQNIDLKDTSKGQDTDFATSPRFIYWPFNGEFWKDELGWYHYTEQAKCK